MSISEVMSKVTFPYVAVHMFDAMSRDRRINDACCETKAEALLMRNIL